DRTGSERGGRPDRAGARPRGSGRAARRCGIRVMAEAAGTTGLLAFAEQVYPMLDRYSYYQLLRVPPSADIRAIRTSYYQIAAQLHPDRYVRLVDPDTRDRLESIYARINEAYRVLTNAEKRAAYDAGLAKGK